MTDHVREITRPRIFFEYACQFYYGFLVNFLKFILIFFFNVSDRDRVGIPMRKLLLVFLTFHAKDMFLFANSCRTKESVILVTHSYRTKESLLDVTLQSSISDKHNLCIFPPPIA